MLKRQLPINASNNVIIWYEAVLQKDNKLKT